MSTQDKMSKADAEVSRFLSYVLRHQPEAIGLHLDLEGWASIAELLQCAATYKESPKDLTRERIQSAVANNDKKRFAVSEDGLLIRAVQGHSTASVDIEYTPKVPPEVLFHGTVDRFLEAIFVQGLLSGKRQYVHLSSDLKTAAAVGDRRGTAVILSIQARQMSLDGYIFYQAENGVWLTREVPVKYLKK